MMKNKISIRIHFADTKNETKLVINKNKVF